MTVCRVAGNEDPALAVFIGERKPQVPESNVLEFHIELRSGGVIQETTKIKAVPVDVGRHRSMKEPIVFKVYSPKESPIAVELRMQDIVEGLARIAIEQAV